MKEIAVIKKDGAKIRFFVDDDVYHNLLKEHSDSIINVTKDTLLINQIDKAKTGYKTIGNIAFKKEGIDLKFNSYKEAIETLGYDAFVEFDDKAYNMVGESLEDHETYKIKALLCKKDKLKDFDFKKLRTLAHSINDINKEGKHE